MNSSSPVPTKQDLSRELGRVAATLSDDMQHAALRKANELGFDLKKGRIPLEETLINLSHNRDTILDVVNKRKLVQLPLKLQYELWNQTLQVSEILTALVNGTDNVLNLENAVDDLTATVWQYNLHNLSDQVLGFHTKMNQLKEQETLIRSVHRHALEFEASRDAAHQLLEQIAAHRTDATDHNTALQALLDQAGTILSKILNHEQQAAALTTQAQQQDAAATQYTANAKAAAADVEALLTTVRTLHAESATARAEFTTLTENVRQVLATTDQNTAAALSGFTRNAEDLRNETVTNLSTLQAKLDTAISEATNTTQARVETAVATMDSRTTDVETQVTQLVTDTNHRLTQAEASHDARLTAQLNAFTQHGETTTEELRTKYAAILTELTQRTDNTLTAGHADLQRLTGDLDVLEGRIRESLNRATGFTLFHSFQKRQLDLASSKKSWAVALALAVLISLGASAYFIYALQYVQVYNAAFYLKLSISLPIIYAIAFCSIQYSRERRLEEEYAFKSTISISLEPYQKLVEQLVDKEKPEERAKYTAFIIESVSRVFTSPTEHIFDEQPKDRNATEKVIKAVGDLIEPIAKAIKR